MRELVGVAHGHLRNALAYSLAIPAQETGIRRFCLWGMGLAVLTLRKIAANPQFTSGTQVKISRLAVRMTQQCTNTAVRNDRLLRILFDYAARGLPLTPPRWCDGRRFGLQRWPRRHVKRTSPGARASSGPPQSDGCRGVSANSFPSDALAIVASGSGARTTSRAVAEPAQVALDAAIEAARDALLRRQSAEGCWQFELEADCTIPAEYIMMMHFLGAIDAPLEEKIVSYLRAHQADHGGWPLYHGGAFDISASVKAYFALKLAGDSPEAPHMKRAREAILRNGGAAATNVFTRIALALFGQLPWRGVPYVPVEIVLLPRWFPFNVHKVSYWSRTVMVPLTILCTLRPLARNPRNVQIRELFTIPPELERQYFHRPGGRASALAPIFFMIDRLARSADGLIPRALRERALQRAEGWMLERLNGEDGLGAIFPAMVNALEALAVRGYSAEDPRRRAAEGALQRLLVVDGSVPTASRASHQCGIRLWRVWRCRRRAVTVR